MPGAMDLKALILAKRKATAEEFQGRKYVKRSDLEAARLQKLRDEEEQERQQGKVCALPVHAAHSAAGLKRVPYCLISQEAFNNERPTVAKMLPGVQDGKLLLELRRPADSNVQHICCARPAGPCAARAGAAGATAEVQRRGGGGRGAEPRRGHPPPARAGSAGHAVWRGASPVVHPVTARGYHCSNPRHGMLQESLNRNPWCQDSSSVCMRQTAGRCCTARSAEERQRLACS